MVIQTWFRRILLVLLPMMRLVISLLALAAFSLPASAQSPFGHNWTPREAYDARKDGDIMALGDVIKQLRSQYGGRYLNARLNGKGTQSPRYIIDWELNGRKVIFTVDARSGRVLNQRGG